MLTPDQMGGLTGTQISALSVIQTAALTPTQIGSLSADAVSNLTAAQIAGLSLPQFGGLTGAQVGALTAADYGRDHHPRCFTIWMAGGGVKSGTTCGETDDFSYNVTRDPVHVHDLNATMLHLLGMDHTKLTYRFNGRDMRLTDVYGELIPQIVKG